MKLNKMLIIQKSLTEDELIRGCLAGKQSAQKALYERFAGKMLSLCVRYIKDREEAEFVMIGGMVKVFEKIRQYGADGSFEGWIRRIMVNECLMYIRKNRNMSVIFNTDNMVDSADETNYLTEIQADELLNLIAGLPVGYRTVFNLYAIEGYSHAEIAEMLEISENTSKSQLSRARKHLQDSLASIEQKTLNTLKK